jgi:phenylpyruvate tautomerase PptA (4-oxalocrotonate tautomerase family)
MCARCSCVRGYQLYVIGVLAPVYYYHDKPNTMQSWEVHRSGAETVFLNCSVWFLSPGVGRMPQYTVTIQNGFVSDDTKKQSVREITRMHTSVMNVPDSFVRVVFLSYPKGSGFTAREETATAGLNCILRMPSYRHDKRDMLKQLWAMFQSLTSIATDQLANGLEEIPSSNAMEMGLIMQAVGHEEMF